MNKTVQQNKQSWFDGWIWRWSRRFRLGTVRYCHPVHQVVINLGFAYIYRHVERDPSADEWAKCPAWKQVQQQLDLAVAREQEL